MLMAMEDILLVASRGLSPQLKKRLSDTGKLLRQCDQELQWERSGPAAPAAARQSQSTHALPNRGVHQIQDGMLQSHPRCLQRLQQCPYRTPYLRIKHQSAMLDLSIIPRRPRQLSRITVSQFRAIAGLLKQLKSRVVYSSLRAGGRRHSNATIYHQERRLSSENTFHGRFRRREMVFSHMIIRRLEKVHSNENLPGRHSCC